MTPAPNKDTAPIDISEDWPSAGRVELMALSVRLGLASRIGNQGFVLVAVLKAVRDPTPSPKPVPVPSPPMPNFRGPKAKLTRTLILSVTLTLTCG